MAEFCYSFEFFPPKTEKAGARLEAALDELETLNPAFVSITYGAGGTTRERTFKTVENILKNRSVDPATHLTCVNASRAEIDEIVQGYLDMGITQFVALRGDPPGSVDGIYTPHPEGYAFGSDLVAGIRSRSPNAKISVSAYPERHPESADWDAEIDNLKRKADAGANQAITQFFFRSEDFLRLQERVADAGMDIPIIPGIMLQPNFDGLKRMAAMCGVDVPGHLARRFVQAQGDMDQCRDITVDYFSGLIQELQNGGVGDFHLYTLNTAPIAAEVVHNIRGQ
ncbi:MAG: methylenetetrahydrofolate reductase [NAD(P)H] [Hellea sp.]|nr:methylenetetrahydrofolate reductase [NAD(P)H] [Hellea sp.]